jgi:hypothetical protein
MVNLEQDRVGTIVARLHLLIALNLFEYELALTQNVLEIQKSNHTSGYHISTHVINVLGGF